MLVTKMTVILWYFEICTAGFHRIVHKLPKHNDKSVFVSINMILPLYISKSSTRLHGGIYAQKQGSTIIHVQKDNFSQCNRTRICQVTDLGKNTTQSHVVVLSE